MLLPDVYPCTLITICSGRERHLANLLMGVRVGKLRPAEIIVVEPAPSDCLSDFPDLSIKPIELPLLDDGSFNVAAARNIGAKLAEHDILVFLDVDCIPDMEFISILVSHPGVEHTLIMGDPRYLRAPLHRGWKMSSLPGLSDRHPSRPILTEAGIQTQEYGLFWSLCFVVHRGTLDGIGGFDEQYSGYGAEDTDLAFTARKLGIPLLLAPAVAYHQQHQVYTPPLNHFHSIVTNCRHFYGKWKVWPMADWLEAFAEMGFIDWEKSGRTLTVIKAPNRHQTDQCRRPLAPYA